MEQLQAKVKVDAGRITGELKHNWNYIGTDECNYIEEPEGQAVLESFGQLEDGPYYVRPHHLFCTGNTRGVLKWGSTNVYTEDEAGNPVYDFTTFDNIFDIVLKTGCKPFFEIGFMPFDLVDPAYFSEETTRRRYREYQLKGWACPPKDFTRWQDMIAEITRHLVDRYGKDEVKTWYFELWNEPDLDYYWKSDIETFNKLYDFTVAGIVSVLPEAYIGGPATTGPKPGQHNVEFLDKFLAHCKQGKNYVTGEIGTRLDFITFHVKGGGFPFAIRAEKGYPTVKTMVDQVELGLDTIRKYGYEKLEVVLSEADPDGWAAGGMHDNINLTFRNTPYYASFVAASFFHLEQLARRKQADVRPLSWAYVFPGERAFEGTRAFQTQGIDKAVLNLFKLYAMMGKHEVMLSSDVAYDYTKQPDKDSEPTVPEVNGFAALDDNDVLTVMLYSHHDNWWDVKQTYNVSLELDNLPMANQAIKISHYRIDDDHSSACKLWEEMGQPYYPAGEDKAALIEKASLTLLSEPELKTLASETLKLDFELPMTGVSLIRVEKEV